MLPSLQSTESLFDVLQYLHVLHEGYESLREQTGAIHVPLHIDQMIKYV